MVHTTCVDCEYNKAGRCHDRVVYGPRGGDLLTDDQTRHCYQVNTTTLLTDLQDKATAKAQERMTSPLWRRIRQDLDLLYFEYEVLDKETADVVDWLEFQARIWKDMGDQIREDKADSDDSE